MFTSLCYFWGCPFPVDIYFTYHSAVIDGICARIIGIILCSDHDHLFEALITCLLISIYTCMNTAREKVFDPLPIL